jgi:NNP family nitrate/nitrite transporter-like MFS transporter
MPAIYDSLIHSQGLAPHKAWRVAYIVPFIIIVVLALCMLFICDDTPTGKWSERHIWMKESNESQANIINLMSGSPSTHPSGPPSINLSTPQSEKKGIQTPQMVDPEAQAVGQVDILRTDTVVAPSRKEIMNVLLSLSTAAVAIPYACSFGSELAINSILGEFYSKNFPHMGQTESGRWAAMFGLLNVVFRPAGGFIADMLYKYTGAVWSKKLLLSFLGVVMGAFQLAIGLTNPRSEATMFGLTAGLAFFLEACNGANFAVVPHVHPFANGKLPPSSVLSLKCHLLNNLSLQVSSPVLWAAWETLVESSSPSFSDTMRRTTAGPSGSSASSPSPPTWPFRGFDQSRNPR